MMEDPGHDKLVRRLAMILIKLNDGALLSPTELAEEFGVNLRTIQRDLNERFSYLPLEKVEGRYRLDPALLGKLGVRDVERFASLAGISGLFPALSEDFLRDIFDTRVQSSFLVKGHDYEDISAKERDFRQLEKAIASRRKVSFRYRRESDERLYAGIEPYKLLNTKGIWYLVGKDQEKIKTFGFSRLEALQVSDETFQLDESVQRTLEEHDGVWLSHELTTVVMRVAPEVASFFKRRRLVANQTLIEELPDGGVLVSSKVGHKNQILPIIRYWLPHITIVEPKSLQKELIDQLKNYLSDQSTSG